MSIEPAYGWFASWALQPDESSAFTGERHKARSYLPKKEGVLQ